MAELLSSCIARDVSLAISSVQDSVACTVNELSQAIQRVSETLSKLNISVMTEDGRYKPFGDIYK